jgi:hypothetical protein
MKAAELRPCLDADIGIIYRWLYESWEQTSCMGMVALRITVLADSESTSL